jgi:hypothetical protein
MRSHHKCLNTFVVEWEDAIVSGHNGCMQNEKPFDVAQSLEEETATIHNPDLLEEIGLNY